MAPYDNAGKIPKTNFIVASVVLFVLAVVFTLGRIMIRLRYQKSLAVDDAFLIFAIVCLCVSVGLLYALTPFMYQLEALITNDPNASIPNDIMDQLGRFRKLGTAFLMVASNTVMSVKFSFLLLFKALIRNVRKINIYWWTVVLTTGTAWVFLIIVFSFPSSLPCPSFGHGSYTCTQDSEYYYLSLGLAVAIAIQDVSTDLMIIVIPILLLWRVQIKFQEKLALGLFLCLSVVMIFATIVQMSEFRSSTKTIDLTWVFFWQLIEASIAVIMVSLTAFRFLFVAKRSGAQSPPHRPSSPKQLLNLRIAVGRKRAGLDDSNEMAGLPKIPRATLTGMRTFIRGKRAEESSMKSDGSGDTEVSWPLEDESAGSTIEAEHEMEPKSERTSTHTEEPSDHDMV